MLYAVRFHGNPSAIVLKVHAANRVELHKKCQTFCTESQLSRFETGKAYYSYAVLEDNFNKVTNAVMREVFS